MGSFSETTIDPTQLLKTLSRVEFFENTVFVFPCGRGKTELFENDDVSVLEPA